MKVIIVGGVAGGATAAARLRRLDESAEIIMIERSGFVSYANCGLPYYIGGTITDRSKLTLQTPQSFRNRFDVDARVRQEVVAIDRAARTVTVRRLDDGTEYVESYDKLILSPGARPVTPDLPGIDAGRLFTLRTVEDTYRIAEFIERKQPRRAVVVGAGFIGLEMAENLRERGLEVTVVQRGEHVMPVFDADMASLLHNHLREHSIELLLKANVTSFEETSNAIFTTLADGRVLESDLVMLSIGVAPESTLAREAGLELGMRGSIKVDATMRTSDPDIYAVGDAVEVTNVVTGSPALIALAGPANKQGRIAADNICGRESEFGGSQGSSVLKLFELDAASTGLTLTAARAAGNRRRSGDSLPRQPRHLLPRCRDHDPQGRLRTRDRAHPGRAGHRARRRGQAHRRARRGHPRPHDRRRPHRARPRLRPSVFLCQRPGEHGRLYDREHPR